MNKLITMVTASNFSFYTMEKKTEPEESQKTGSQRTSLPATPERSPSDRQGEQAPATKHPKQAEWNFLFWLLEQETNRHTLTHTENHTHTPWDLRMCVCVYVCVLPVLHLTSGGAHDVTMMSQRVLTSICERPDVLSVCVRVCVCLSDSV